MNFDRYLATSYPIFHRTSITRGRLLTLLAILIIVEITLNVMSVNDFVISDQVHGLILCILFIPAMLFINYKLFLIVRKSRKNKRISPDMKKTLSLKNISSCLLVVACVVVLSIPSCVYIGLRINSPETKISLDNANLAPMWVKTIALINCTSNCLIFYWKNKRCYVPKDGKCWKTWKYVDGLNPSCTNNKKLKARRKLTNNILVIANVNATNCTLILFYILIRMSSSL
jgi:hypothetical protein